MERIYIQLQAVLGNRDVARSLEGDSAADATDTVPVAYAPY